MHGFPFQARGKAGAALHDMGVAAVLLGGRDRAGLAARTYLVAGFGSLLALRFHRGRQLECRKISGQNSRSTFPKPMSLEGCCRPPACAAGEETAFDCPGICVASHDRARRPQAFR